MGDDFTKATGLNARDPSTIRQQIDFAMNHVRRHGWGAWMGAKAEGIYGFRGVGALPAGAVPGISTDRTPIGGVGQPHRAMAGIGSGSKPVELARSMLGTGSDMAARALGHEMHYRAWCADFVNATLDRTGGKGTGNAMARSFLRWGQHVDNSSIKSGDVLVNQGHVGFARGPAEMHNGRMMIPMIAGNHGNRVGESWEPIGKYEARRGSGSEQPAAVPPVLAEHARERGEERRQRREHQARMEKASSGGKSHGPITIHVAAQPHHSEKEIAAMVHRRFNDAVSVQTSDGYMG